VRAGRFRADLYYRLNVMTLRLPPLRERRGDILPLARRAIQACARGGQAALSLSPQAERKLLHHDWPGNARELTNIVQRAAWLASGGIIHAADLDTGVAAEAALGGPTGMAASGAEPGCAPGEHAAAPAGTQEVGLDHDLKERERELIMATLRVTGGSRKLTAERLGISPRTLRHKLQQLKAAGHSVPRVHDHQLAAV
jgi:two-component system response regulator FlrC